MDMIISVIDFAIQSLAAEFLAVVAGILVVQRVQSYLDNRRFGDWVVVVIQDGVEKVRREISVPKSKEIFTEEAELSVFVKGVVSPYAQLRFDILQKGREDNILVENKKERELILNLDKIGEKERASKEGVL